MGLQAYDEPKFLVVNKKSDWEKGILDNIVYCKEDKGIKLGTGTGYTRTNMIELSDKPLLQGIRGIATGKNGLIYLLTAKQESTQNVLVYDSIKDCAEALDIRAKDAGKFFVCGSSKLYMLDCQLDNTVNALDLRDCVISFSLGLSFTPSSFFADDEDNLYVLDAERNTVFKIDRYGSVEDSYYIGSGNSCYSDIAVYRGSVLYAFDSKQNRVVTFDLNKREFTNEGHDFDKSFKLKGLGVGEKGNARIAFSTGVQVDGYVNGFVIEYENKTNTEIYNGHIDSMAVDVCGRIYILDSSEQIISVYAQDSAAIEPFERHLTLGTYISHSFDSTEYDMRWHRIVLDMEVLADTQVELYYYASNEKTEIKSLEEPSIGWNGPLINPFDALINADGRYLFLKIVLVGTAFKTPNLRGIYAYFPRSSYLRYLPAVYQEDEESRSFLERFLSIFETQFLGIEREIDSITKYFDTKAAPYEFLTYIASWLGLPVDETFSEEVLRRLVEKAPILYERRGTRMGLKEAVGILAGTSPFIVESFQIKNMEEILEEDDRVDLYRLYADDPYSFNILINQVLQADKGRYTVKRIGKNELASINRMLEWEKPAFTKACVVLLEPCIYLGMHTYLGVNTCLGDPELILDSAAFVMNDPDYVDIDNIK